MLPEGPRSFARDSGLARLSHLMPAAAQNGSVIMEILPGSSGTVSPGRNSPRRIASASEIPCGWPHNNTLGNFLLLLPDGGGGGSAYEFLP